MYGTLSYTAEEITRFTAAIRDNLIKVVQVCIIVIFWGKMTEGDPGKGKIYVLCPDWVLRANMSRSAHSLQTWWPNLF